MIERKIPWVFVVAGAIFCPVLFFLGAGGLFLVEGNLDSTWERIGLASTLDQRSNHDVWTIRVQTSLVSAAVWLHHPLTPSGIVVYHLADRFHQKVSSQGMRTPL